MKNDKEEFYLRIRQLGVLTTIPFMLVGGPLIGYFVGDWIDQKYDVDPYGKGVLMVLGFLGAAKETYRMIKDIIKQG